MVGACKEFLFGFFDGMDEGLLDRITEAIHDYQNRTVEETSNIFEEITLEIENNHGSDYFVGHMVVREFALLLNKRESKVGAIDFLNRRLKRIGNDDDFHTLMTISSLHEKNGEYQKAIEVLERAKKIIPDDDDLKMSLISLKLACDHWNFESRSVASYGYQEKGMNLLRSLQTELNQLTSPSSERGMMFVDAYKTAAYLYGAQDNYPQSGDCYEKALNTLRKSPNSKLQHLKGLTWLCRARARNGSYGVTFLIEEAVNIANELKEDDDFMKAHTDSVTHILSRLAHSYQVMKQLDNSLKVRLTALDVMKTFFGESHPAVARMSADIALNFYLLKSREKCDEYIATSEDILRSCGYKEDITKAKLYFREISDTLRILANLFAMMNEYGDSEEHYKRALDLHEKVYGSNHQRTARIYRYLGVMYSRWGKKEKAIETLNKAIEIQRLYLPASQEFILNIQKDLAKATKYKPRRGGKRF